MRNKTITFIVTKDCQLACKYCYLVGKNNNERMSLEVAKEAIDFILREREFFNEDSVSFDFIGGEPLLEANLMNDICDYIKLRLYTERHPWFDHYMFGFTTNGLNYHTEAVQKLIHNNKFHIDATITIDGTRKKHDINRVYKSNGRGSYDDVVKNIPLWLSQFPNASTKVTISSEDIPYIYESVMHLISLNIHTIHINCVFEDVWKPGDDDLLEEQLTQLADALIDGGYYRNFEVSFFNEFIGKPMSESENNNWCGAGRMLSIDCHGNFYPCTRFAKYSLRSKQPIIIGNAKVGINMDLLRPFLTLNRITQSPQKCKECEVASGCAWCQGENYDASSTGTIYERATAICKMHKARVRANNYFWNRLYQKLESEGEDRNSVLAIRNYEKDLFSC